MIAAQNDKITTIKPETIGNIVFGVHCTVYISVIKIMIFSSSKFVSPNFRCEWIPQKI